MGELLPRSTPRNKKGTLPQAGCPGLKPESRHLVPHGLREAPSQGAGDHWSDWIAGQPPRCPVDALGRRSTYSDRRPASRRHTAPGWSQRSELAIILQPELPRWAVADLAGSRLVGFYLAAEFVCLGVGVDLRARFPLWREAEISGLRFPPYTKPCLPCAFLPA